MLTPPRIDFSFLTGFAKEIVIGLLGAGVSLGLTELFSWRKKRRLERNFPIAGYYISKYEDQGHLHTAMVKLKQLGSNISGETTEKHRKWIIEGEVTSDGYLLGRYSPESVLDKGFGAFLLRIDGDCDMDGHWFGRDAKETAIQHGSYRFLKNSASIHNITANDVTEVLKIAEGQLGDAYINSSDLMSSKTGIALCAKLQDRIVGFGTAKIIDAKDFYSKLLSFFSNDTALRPLQRRLEGEKTIGLIASVATAPSATGRGIGTMLIAECIEHLEKLDINIIAATAWRSSKGVQAGSILENRGFQSVLEIANYWKDDSEKHCYMCPVCGPPPCQCSAVIYLR
jgi:GNAT superfamily N-acetyltransferase